MTALFSALVLLALTTSGCASTADAGAGPRVCKKDLDCGDHQYCTLAGVCRTDCFKDTDCVGPFPDSQCNAQGRCIDSVDAAEPPADVTPSDALLDGPVDGEGGK